MPTCVIQLEAPPYGNFSLELYPFDSDDVEYTIALTERTNNKGTYRANLANPVVGWYDARVVTDTNDNIAKYVVYLLDAAVTCRCADPTYTPFLDPAVLAAIADAYLDREDGTESGETPRQTQRLMRATLLGNLHRDSDSLFHFRSRANNKNRVSAELDGNGGRIISTDPS